MPRLRIRGEKVREQDIQTAIQGYLAGRPDVYTFKVGRGQFAMEHQGRKRIVNMGPRGVADIIGWKVEPVRHFLCFDQDCAQSLFVEHGVFTEIRHHWHYHLREIPRFLAIEVKRRGGKPPTPEQRAFLARVRAVGGLAVVAYSVQDVVDALGIPRSP